MVETPAWLKFGSPFVKSYEEVIKGTSRTTRSSQSMAYQSFYCGLPPRLAPGLFAMFPYSEHQGLFYPRGGMVQVPAEIAGCGEKAGMKVELEKRVERVMVGNGRAPGCRLGGRHPDHVGCCVSDIHARTLYLDIVGEENLHGSRERDKELHAVGVGAGHYVGVDYRPPLGAHHTLVTVPMEDLDDYW